MSLCWLSLWWMSWRQLNVWNEIFLTIHFKSTVSEFSFDIYVTQSLVKWSQSRDKCKSSAVISDFECFVLSKKDATTFSKTTLSITTFSKTALSITTFNKTALSKTTFSKMTLSITTFNKMTLSITTFNKTTLSITIFGKTTLSITIFGKTTLSITAFS